MFDWLNSEKVVTVISSNGQIGSFATFSCICPNQDNLLVSLITYAQIISPLHQLT